MSRHGCFQPVDQWRVSQGQLGMRRQLANELRLPHCNGGKLNLRTSILSLILAVGGHSPKISNVNMTQLNGHEINSLCLGDFYEAPSAGSPPSAWRKCSKALSHKEAYGSKRAPELVPQCSASRACWALSSMCKTLASLMAETSVT